MKQTNKNNAKAYYNKGVSLGKLGKYEEALKEYDETIKLNPKQSFLIFFL